jgi:site-specific DNA-cytosine methylase
MDGETHEIPGKWDLIIAHPPCTDLAVSGARWFPQKQKDGRQQKSIVFFMLLALADASRVAVENPVCIMSSAWRKPDQIIQPYQFGHHARKTTCLWLKGLPPLTPTEVVDPGEIRKGGFSVGASLDMARDENGKIISWNDPRTAKIRSRTFEGIGRAMAEQWGAILKQEVSDNG